MLSAALLLVFCPLYAQAFTQGSSFGVKNSVKSRFVALNLSQKDAADNRREFLNKATSSICLAGMSVGLVMPTESAMASGGATAGKYTTIPIAKRRYYGRVQQAVHEFLDLAPEVIAGDMTATKIQTFFDVTATVVVEAKNKSINGQCTKKDRDCKGKEVRDSRYNDMKTSMYLLGNAFRLNQQKAPDNLPTVKAAKAFFKDMDEMEKLCIKKPKKNDPKAQALYTRALDTLDIFLDLVELPPTDSGHYNQEFDTLVGATSRIT